MSDERPIPLRQDSVRRDAGLRAMDRRQFLRLLTLGGLTLSAGGLLTTVSCAPSTPASKPAPAADQGAPAVGKTAAQPSAAGQPKAGGTLLVGIEADVGPLDNNMNWGAITGRILEHIYDRVLNVDVTNPHEGAPEIGPGLAEKVDVAPDGLSYTFSLRKGVKFHDGSPWNAEAFKFNVERNYKEDHPFFHKAGAGVTRQVYRAVDRTEVVDEHTARVFMKQVYGDFLHYMSIWQNNIASPEAIKKHGNEEYGNNAVGTGPFKFVEHIKGERLVLERFDDYWGEKPYLDKIIWRPITEPAQRVNALLTKEADWINVVPPDNRAQIEADRNLVFSTAVFPHTWCWMLNFREKPFNQLEVRQAANYALDRERLVKDILKDTASPAYQTFGPGSTAHRSLPDNLKMVYDPEKAKSLIRQAGYPDGFETEWWFPISGSGMMIPGPMNEFIQQNLAQVGIRIKFKTFEWQTYLQSFWQGIPTGQNVGAFNQSWNSDFGYNANRFFDSQLQAPNGANINWYSNPKIDEMLKQANLTTDEPKRMDLYADVDAMVVQDAAWLWVVHDNAPRAWHSKVQGFFNPHSWFYSFKKTWLA